MIPSLTCPAAPYQGVKTWAMSTGLGPLFDFMDRLVNAQSSERIAMEQGLALLEKSVRCAGDNKTMYATKRRLIACVAATLRSCASFAGSAARCSQTRSLHKSTRAITTTKVEQDRRLIHQRLMANNIPIIWRSITASIRDKLMVLNTRNTWATRAHLFNTSLHRSCTYRLHNIVDSRYRLSVFAGSVVTIAHSQVKQTPMPMSLTTD